MGSTNGRIVLLDPSIGFHLETHPLDSSKGKIGRREHVARESNDSTVPNVRLEHCGSTVPNEPPVHCGSMVPNEPPVHCGSTVPNEPPAQIDSPDSGSNAVTATGLIEQQALNE